MRLVAVARCGIDLSPSRHMGVQDLDPQRVRKIGLEFRRAPAEHRVPIRDRTRHQVREQPRLADPRLALDRHHRARARG